MKKISLTFLFFLCAFTASFAQDDSPQTLIKDIKKISAFGGPIMEFSSINDDFAFFMGGGGALLFNKVFYVGGYGMGLTTSNLYKDGTPPTDQRLDFGHGGFWLGYIIATNKLIHLDINTQLGWGGLNIYNRSNNNLLYNDNAFVVQPQLNVELNLTKFMRLCAGGSYRLVSGVDKDNAFIDPEKLNTPSFSLGVRFGWFN